MRRFVFALTVGGLSLSPLADSAVAATCFTLQAELTHLQSQGGGGSAQDRARYERAYREQIEVIARTESRARDAGCFGTGFVFFESEPDAACATLVPRLQEMQVNLGRLDRLRMSSDSGNAERIQEVQGMIADRGCGMPGGDDWYAGSESIYDLDSSYSMSGRFRTVCVRTCDGYYFPISYSTTMEQFPADAGVCASMCPGTDTRLYYYPNPGGRVENMVSLEGSHYADLPTAFRYRTRFEPSCSCGGAGSRNPVGVALAQPSEQEPVPLDPIAPLPHPRPAPGEDPETLANRAGNFVPRMTSEEEMASAGATVTAGGRTIRVIGPVFGPSAEQQDALLNPVPN